MGNPDQVKTMGHKIQAQRGINRAVLEGEDLSSAYCPIGVPEVAVGAVEVVAAAA